MLRFLNSSQSRHIVWGGGALATAASPSNATPHYSCDELTLYVLQYSGAVDLVISFTMPPVSATALTVPGWAHAVANCIRHASTHDYTHLTSFPHAPQGTTLLSHSAVLHHSHLVCPPPWPPIFSHVFVNTETAETGPTTW
jgi:hypothetical protein